MAMSMPGNCANLDSLGQRKHIEDNVDRCNDKVSSLDSDWSKLQFIPCEELWLDDGNIVIRARSKPSDSGAPPIVRGFKCHKSVLASESQFFKTLFELPQAAGEQTTFDGLPCVDFPDDFEDVRDSLLMSYNRL